MWYHGKPASDDTPEARRAAKARRVREGHARAALIYTGDDCVG